MMLRDPNRPIWMHIVHGILVTPLVLMFTLTVAMVVTAILGAVCTIVAGGFSVIDWDAVFYGVGAILSLLVWAILVQLTGPKV